MENGLEEKVISISRASIHPSITPEVRVCPFKSDVKKTQDDMAVILIRVEESFDTPHMYSKEKANAIYIREHNETNPADTRTIEDLIKKNKIGEEKFDSLLKEKIAPRRHPGYRMVFVVPSSPIKHIIQFNKDMDKFLKDNEPMHLRFGNYKPIRSGGYFEYRSEFSVEITSEGLICYRENYSMDTENSQKKQNGDIMIDRTMVIFIQKIYEKVGYYGKVTIGLEIYGTENKFLFTTPGRGLDMMYTTNEKEILEKQIFSFDDFSTINIPSIEIFENLFRSFGLAIDRSTLTSWISSYIK
ncbi:MAG: hypothetical protein NTY91_03050 [Euryarchaeota archaeon]|nr:hypothetical protein [Euryarchaeota archaeon]